MATRLLHGCGKREAAARCSAVHAQDAVRDWRAALDTQTRVAQSETRGYRRRTLGRAMGEEQAQEAVETSRGLSTV
jgi:hypothetical protein